MAGSAEQPERTPEFYEKIMQRDQELILEQKEYISKLKALVNRLEQQKGSLAGKLKKYEYKAVVK